MEISSSGRKLLVETEEVTVSEEVRVSEKPILAGVASTLMDAVEAPAQVGVGVHSERDFHRLPRDGRQAAIKLTSFY
jgi:hypothetical protein